MTDDLISRQAVQDYIAKYLSQYLYEDVRQAVEVIDEFIGELPSVNPQEPKTGHWKKIQSGDKDFPESIVCSRCGHENSYLDFGISSVPIGKSFKKSKFCPNCGAKMVEPQESEDK